MLIIWRGLKMDNETFVETFKRILEIEEPQDSYNYGYIFPSSIELMEIYFDQLNDTNLSHREKFIANKLFPAMLSYSSNEITKIVNEAYKSNRPTNPKRELDKNRKIVDNFENMIYEYLNGGVIEHNEYIEDKELLAKEKPHFTDFELEMYSKNGKKNNIIKALLDTTQQLKNELSSGNFHYFPKHKFYADTLVPKKEIEKLLIDFAKAENLKGYTLEIQQFIDNL